MNIREIKTNKKQYLQLLMLADEQESMIDRYLERGDMYVMVGNTSEIICVAVVTDEGESVCELKNLAVAPQFQRQGYGRKMIEHLCAMYGEMFSYTVLDFFTVNYDHTIIEDGKILTDMLYFRKKLIPPHTSVQTV